MSNKCHCLLLCFVFCIVLASQSIAGYQESGGVLSMESENGTLGSRWITGSDTGASNGAYIEINPAYDHTGTAPECTTAECIAVYDFNISTSGNYKFWFRMLSDNGSDDSFFWRIDSGSWIIENNRSDGWLSTDNTQVDTLSAGGHVLEISYRENGTRLDKFVIQLDSLTAPSGNGPDESPGDQVNNPPSVDAGSSQTMMLPREYLTLNGSASDDGLGEPNGFLESTWSQISGPAAEFVTDIHQTNATVRCPSAGDYEFQLDATDGLLNATPDTVIITVADPVCPVGDVDGDCKVTLSDLGLIGLDWLDNTGTSSADLDGDTWVKMQDLSLLGQTWQEDWTGSLKVTILPAEVLALGAQWRVDGGLWKSSGATVSSLPEGSHNVEFSVVEGWSIPENQPVTITRQELTQASGTYSEISQTLVISEFMAINSYIPYINSMNVYTDYAWTYPDDDGEVHPDWIELHNNGTESIDLAGWYLTDNPDDLTKWQFPSDMGSKLILDPDEYFIVFASNKEQVTFPANYPFVDYYGALHTNFELGANGEYLAVIVPDGVTVCHAYDDYPKQIPFTSYGIASDDSIGYLTTPTPGTRVSDKWTGAANMSTSLPGIVDDTKFSHSRGFYDSPFDVSISCSTLGAEIHYTVDGTEPQATVGGYTYLYSGPITISTTTCLRAKAFKSGLMPSNIDTQTYLFLDDVVEQVKPADSRYSTSAGVDPVVGLVPADYEMENDTTDIKLVAGNAGYTVEQAKSVIKDALLDIPTLSVVSDPAGIFGDSDGINTNPNQTGLLWERAVSAEYFNGDPNDAFQIDCGFRIQGGHSRDPRGAGKHSLSLRFRGGYGSSKLKSNILDHQTSVGQYDTLMLRAGYNNSWFSNYVAERERALLIRDQLVRDCIVAMGQADGLSGTYVHLYINGLYWGVYDMHERPEASHVANYYGGDSDWYDAIKGDEAVDGTWDSWNNLKTLVYGASSSSQADWEAICAKLDIENVIDWSIVQCWSWNHDMHSSSNWAAAGGGVFDAPWRYYPWDVERTFEEGTVADPEKESIFGTGGNFLTGALDDFAEFRIRFADRVYKHFYNQGALTAASAQSIFNSRVTELQDAIIGESARWGDYRRDFYASVYTKTPIYLYTKTDFWQPAASDVNGWLAQKESNAITFFQGRGLYPSIEPPVYTINSVEQSGGYVTIPCTFDMDNNNGTGDVYYTLDGTDPREYWTGNVSGTAVLFNGTPITLDKSTIVKARVKSGTTWSALHEAVYVDDQIVNSIRITEMMYNPTDLNTEFVELKNIGTSAINLNLVQFTNGIDFTFGDISVPAGGYVVVVQNTAEFNTRYPSFSGTIAGQYTGILDNAGEKVELVDGSGTIIHEFNYKDGWYDLTDGFGFSLTIRDPLGDLPLWDQKIGWRSSVNEGGTPGEAAVSVLTPGSIVINEVLAHSHAAAPDWIELRNTTGSNINISGWFLSDNNDDDPNLMKYEIQSTSIPAYGYAVFVENVTFGNPLDLGCHMPFGLSEAGETVYLHSGAGGQITGYYQTEENFDATETGITIGRYEKAELSGGYDFTRMLTPTQGSENSDPLIPDVVIAEIYYHPSEGEDYEFVELYNSSGSPVTLMSLAKRYTSETTFVTENVPWRLEGTGYEFPASTTIPAGGRIIVVKDPDNYGGASSTVLGPYDGQLSNGGEQIELQIPGDWEYGELSRYWIPIEKIDYDDETPWPTSPDGTGDSLHRQNTATYGRDYSNWSALPPTPGS